MYLFDSIEQQIMSLKWCIAFDVITVICTNICNFQKKLDIEKTGISQILIKLQFNSIMSTDIYISD